MLYLRARYYDPATGTFPSLDPFEGTAARPMSLNGYMYVEGNVPNATDPSGMFANLQVGTAPLYLAATLNGGTCSQETIATDLNRGEALLCDISANNGLTIGGIATGAGIVNSELIGRRLPIEGAVGLSKFLEPRIRNLGVGNRAVGIYCNFREGNIRKAIRLTVYLGVSLTTPGSPVGAGVAYALTYFDAQITGFLGNIRKPLPVGLTQEEWFEDHLGIDYYRPGGCSTYGQSWSSYDVAWSAIFASYTGTQEIQQQVSHLWDTFRQLVESYGNEGMSEPEIQAWASILQNNGMTISICSLRNITSEYAQGTLIHPYDVFCASC